MFPLNYNSYVFVAIENYTIATVKGPFIKVKDLKIKAVN